MGILNNTAQCIFFVFVNERGFLDYGEMMRMLLKLIISECHISTTIIRDMERVQHDDCTATAIFTTDMFAKSARSFRPTMHISFHKIYESLDLVNNVSCQSGAAN